MRSALLLLALGTLGARAQQASGFVESGGRLVHFEIVRDSVVVIGQGVEGRPSVAMPYAAFAQILERGGRAGALDAGTPGDATPFSLDVDDRAVVRLATAVPAGELALGLLALGLFTLVAGAVVWERRARRSRRMRTEFRRRLASAREAERAFVARELHDGPVQDLCAVQLALGATDGGEPARAAVTGVVGELRALCDQLRPSALDAFGLPAALAALADRAGWHRGAATGDGARTDLDVRFRTDDHTRALAAVLDADRQLALYRIAQEALNNAAEHAQASRVDVALVRDGDRLVLSVDDDGVGPPVEDALSYAARGHYGLLGMQERADLLKTDLALTRSPLGGTRVAVELRVPAHRVPLPDPDHA